MSAFRLTNLNALMPSFNKESVGVITFKVALDDAITIERWADDVDPALLSHMGDLLRTKQVSASEALTCFKPWMKLDNPIHQLRAVQVLQGFVDSNFPLEGLIHAELTTPRWIERLMKLSKSSKNPHLKAALCDMLFSWRERLDSAEWVAAYGAALHSIQASLPKQAGASPSSGPRPPADYLGGQDGNLGEYGTMPRLPHNPQPPLASGRGGLALQPAASGSPRFSQPYYQPQQQQQQQQQMQMQAQNTRQPQQPPPFSGTPLYSSYQPSNSGSPSPRGTNTTTLAHSQLQAGNSYSQSQSHLQQQHQQHLQQQLQQEQALPRYQSAPNQKPPPQNSHSQDIYRSTSQPNAPNPSSYPQGYPGTATSNPSDPRITVGPATYTSSQQLQPQYIPQQQRQLQQSQHSWPPQQQQQYQPQVLSNHPQQQLSGGGSSSTGGPGGSIPALRTAESMDMDAALLSSQVDQIRLDANILLDCLDEALAAVTAHRQGRGDYKKASQQLAKVSLLAQRCQEWQDKVMGWLSSDVTYPDDIVTNLLDTNELLLLVLEKYQPLHRTNLGNDSAQASTSSSGSTTNPTTTSQPTPSSKTPPPPANASPIDVMDLLFPATGTATFPPPPATATSRHPGMTSVGGFIDLGMLSTQQGSNPPAAAASGSAASADTGAAAATAAAAAAAARSQLEAQVASLREQLSSVATSAGIASLQHSADLASAASAHAAQVSELKRQAIQRVEELLRQNAAAEGELRGLQGKLAAQEHVRRVLSEAVGSGIQGSAAAAAESVAAVAAAEAAAAEHWAAEVDGARGKAAELEAMLSGKEGEMASLKAAAMALAASSAKQVASLSAQLQAAQMQLRKAATQAPSPAIASPPRAVVHVQPQQPFVPGNFAHPRETEVSEDATLLGDKERSSSHRQEW